MNGSTGVASLIQSMKNFEKSSWGKNWSISSTTCGPKTRTNCSKCVENKYSHEVPIKTALPNCQRTEGIPERKCGFWVGALSPWCHCSHKSGGTLPLLGDAAQPLWLTPRMAGVATVHTLLRENSRETSTEKRQKREEKEGARKRKTSPTPLPRELERDARGL